MVEVLKDAVADSTREVANAMASTNPFLGATLVALLLFLGWMAYDSHQMRKDLVGIKVADAKMEAQRQQSINDFNDRLKAIEQAEMQKTVEREKQFTEVEAKVDDNYKQGKVMVEKIFDEITRMNEKIDHVIQNQQMRSVIRGSEQLQH